MLRHEARQEGRAASEGHDRARAPALGARPQVRRADARHGARRRSSPATRSRSRTPGDAVEFDDLLNTFDEETRQNAQDATTGFGNALAGRGQRREHGDREPSRRSSTTSTPVMANLSDPETELDEFFKQIGRAVGAGRAGRRRAGASCSRDGRHLRRDRARPGARSAPRSSRRPPTLDAAIASFREQRPFLADFADLSRRLRPAAQRAADRAAAPQRRASASARRSCAAASILNEATSGLLDALDDLAEDPNTLLGLKDLDHAWSRSARPLFDLRRPYQTVCNYATYFLTGLGSHISEGTPNGTAQRVLLKLDNCRSRQPHHRLPATGRPTCRPTSTRLGAKNAEGSNRYTIARPAVRAGDRRPGQRRLPGRPVRATSTATPAPSGATRRPTARLTPIRCELRRLREGPQRRQPRRDRERPALPARPDIHRPAQPEDVP